MIQLDIRIRTKNPTPTPSVIKDPAPPKNLRLRNPDYNTDLWGEFRIFSQTICEKYEFSIRGFV